MVGLCGSAVGSFYSAPCPPRTTVEPEAEEAVGSIESISEASITRMPLERPTTAKVVAAPTGPLGDADWGVGSRWGEDRRIEIASPREEEESPNVVWNDWWNDITNSELG